MMETGAWGPVEHLLQATMYEILSLDFLYKNIEFLNLLKSP
jgi:hypothetical protein